MLKKCTALFTALLLACSLAACGGKTASAENDLPLTDLMASITEGVPDMPNTGETEITDENVQSYLFVPSLDGGEALASEALINAVPHSVVLLRMPDEASAKTMAAEIEKNADPRKWVCVMADKTTVTQSGRTVLLVMSSEATADAITANFENLMK